MAEARPRQAPLQTRVFCVSVFFLQQARVCKSVICSSCLTRAHLPSCWAVGPPPAALAGGRQITSSLCRTRDHHPHHSCRQKRICARKRSEARPFLAAPANCYHKPWACGPALLQGTKSTGPRCRHDECLCELFLQLPRRRKDEWGRHPSSQHMSCVRPFLVQAGGPSPVAHAASATIRPVRARVGAAGHHLQL